MNFPCLYTTTFSSIYPNKPGVIGQLSSGPNAIITDENQGTGTLSTPSFHHVFYLLHLGLHNKKVAPNVSNKDGSLITPLGLSKHVLHPWEQYVVGLDTLFFLFHRLSFYNSMVTLFTTNTNNNIVTCFNMFYLICIIMFQNIKIEASYLPE